MPLNATQSERVKRASEELAIKLQLEAAFTRDMRRFFRRISADLQQSVAQSGGSVSAGAYSNDLRVILDKNYKRVQRRFNNEIAQFLRANVRNDNEAIINELSMIADARGITLNQTIRELRQRTQQNSIAFRQFNVGQTVLQVIETTQKEIDRSLRVANQNLIAEFDDTPTNAQLARQVRLAFLPKQFARAAMISATETQNAAEGTKQIERDSFLAIRNNFFATQLELEPRTPAETWVTQGDSFVRNGDGEPFNHLAADGQVKKNGIFIVSDEAMLRPGDRSLGASAGNVIRCRCSAVTTIH